MLVNLPIQQFDRDKIIAHLTINELTSLLTFYPLLMDV